MIRILEFLLKFREKNKASLWEQVNNLSFFLFSLCLFIYFVLLFCPELFSQYPGTYHGKLLLLRDLKFLSIQENRQTILSWNLLVPIPNTEERIWLEQWILARQAHCLEWSWGSSWKRGRDNFQKWWSLLYRQTNAKWLMQGNTQLVNAEKRTEYQEAKWLTLGNRAH